MRIVESTTSVDIKIFFQESTKVPSSAVLAVISKHFLKMQEADSPLDKLENLLAAISVMFNAVSISSLKFYINLIVIRETKSFCTQIQNLRGRRSMKSSS